MPRTIVAAALIWISIFAARSATAQQFRTSDRQFHNGTSFPLDGKHRTADCESCHVNSVYKGTPTACFDCHWVRRQDDLYRLQLGSKCEQCHRPSAWTDVRWNHAAMTSMPLNAAHRQLTCASCHRGGTFRRTEIACASCHLAEYQATREPNHVAAGFPATCESCHRASDVSFRGARFNHAAVFPLVGIHAAQTCATCHANGMYRGTPRTCVGCHQDEYNRTTAPNHAAAGFSTDCESCHRNSDPGWRGSASGGFNHAAIFPLVGVHAQQLCATCHVNGVFKGTPRTCAGCHLADYNRAASPNHIAAGFPTTCDSCHRASDPTWHQGTFNHRFPIAAGNHRTACATCHTSASNFKVFTCLVCHEHSRTLMDSKHRGRQGYLYDSLACYACHPNGKH